jgi:hypothetical protein
MLSAERGELCEELQPLLGRPDRHQRLHDQGVGARGTVRRRGVGISCSWGVHPSDGPELHPVD